MTEKDRSDEPPKFARCPRCGRIMNAADLLSGSRVVAERDILICNLCGEFEAERDMTGRAPIPLDEWPVDADELGRDFAAHCRSHQASTFEGSEGDQ